MFINILDWLRDLLFLTYFKFENIQMTLAEYNGTKNSTSRAKLTSYITVYITVTLATGFLGRTQVF